MVFPMCPMHESIDGHNSYNKQWVQWAILFANDRERKVIGELWLAKLPNVRGCSLTQMLTERTAVQQITVSSLPLCSC